MKLIELWSEDSLALRELGADRSSGYTNKIHFNQRTCKRSAYIHAYMYAHISCSYDHVTF